MKLILTPRRHGRPLAHGEKPQTEEERLSGIAEGRRRLVADLKRKFPQALVLGIEGKGEIQVELPDSEPDLPARIRAALDVETGPVPGADPQMPVWRDIAPTPEAVAEAHRGKEYRPTVVALVRDESGRILLVQSRFNAAEWMLVQGGIEEDETPLLALARELREEIDVGPAFFAPSGYVGTADLDAEDGRADKRGFTKGKRYFIYEVAYRGPEELRLQEAELAGHEWIQPRLDDLRLLTLLSGVRTGKRRLIVGAIVRILS